MRKTQIFIPRFCFEVAVLNKSVALDHIVRSLISPPVCSVAVQSPKNRLDRLFFNPDRGKEFPELVPTSTHKPTLHISNTKL